MTLRRNPPARRGTVLIVTLSIILILVALVLVTSRSMSIEAMASANYVASAQASSVEIAAEQYAVALVVNNQANPVFGLPDTSFAAIPVGTGGYFWIIRPTYGDPNFSAFGLVDEASKINLNTASTDMLQSLPILQDNPDIAQAIYDWRTGGQSEDSYYQSLPVPYETKNSNFETVDELLLIQGMTRDMLYGQPVDGGAVRPGRAEYYGQAATGIVSTSATNITDPDVARGLYDYFTVFSKLGGAPAVPPALGRPGIPASIYQVNVNTAPHYVLVALGLTDDDADKVISGRQMTDTDTTTVASILGGDWTTISRSAVGTSSQFSADIVAVSANGRSFKRCRIVIDASSVTAPPQIVFRRDISDSGWPMDPEILASLRRGEGIPGSTQSTPASASASGRSN